MSARLLASFGAGATVAAERRCFIAGAGAVAHLAAGGAVGRANALVAQEPPLAVRQLFAGQHFERHLLHLATAALIPGGHSRLATARWLAKDGNDEIDDDNRDTTHR